MVYTAFDTGKTQNLNIQTHYMKERFSESRRVHKVNFKSVAPLFDSSDKAVGYIVSSKAEIIDKTPEGHGLRFI